MVGRLVTYAIYLESFQSWATLRFIARPGCHASFSGTACMTSELKCELGQVFDHFYGGANDMKLYHAPGTKGAARAPLRIPEKHGKPCEDDDFLNPKAGTTWRLSRARARPTGA